MAAIGICWGIGRREFFADQVKITRRYQIGRGHSHIRARDTKRAFLKSDLGDWHIKGFGKSGDQGSAQLLCHLVQHCSRRSRAARAKGARSPRHIMGGTRDKTDLTGWQSKPICQDGDKRRAMSLPCIARAQVQEAAP